MFVAEVAESARYPMATQIRGQDYFVLRHDQTYWLASRTCPHQGGLVHHYPDESCLRCPLHNWIFDQETGEGINTANPLSMLMLELRDGQLWLRPEDESRLPYVQVSRKKPTLTDLGKVPDLTIELLAHASLRISSGKYEILIDPWLDGPAMLGAWRQYPHSQISARDLSPAAIIITHEHSDHFHLPTLLRFDKATPIFLPGFDNGRMEYFLDKLGFTNVTTVAFETKAKVADVVQLTYFRPVSIFNDSIMLLNVGGYKLLNLNDAGLNAKIASSIGPVDLISCIFSTGASGYPMTWTHIDDAEKERIMERACHGRLDMLVEALGVYNANRLLPFASYFKLWLPKHRQYLAQMRTNTLDEVVDHFRSKGLGDRIVDLLPGENWNPKTNTASRVWSDRAGLFAPQTIAENLELDYAENGDQFGINDFWGTFDFDLMREDVVSYFDKLNANPDIRHCEDVFLRVRCFSRDWTEQLFEVPIRIVKSQLTVEPVDCEPDGLPTFHLDVTEDILKPILSENVSWDEARVGCHLRWWRNTNAVHTGLLRLLQGPYGQKRAEHEAIRRTGVSASNSIASVIEMFGDDASRIFSRCGLYCVGCSLSPWESIEAGAAKHGLTQAETASLLEDINRLASTH